MSAIIEPRSTPLRSRQFELLRAVADRLSGRAAQPLVWSLADVQRAGVATGLTALAASLKVFDTSDGAVADYLADQRAEVARRHERFAAVVPRALGLLRGAGVTAVPVKGAVLCGHSGGSPVWPEPAARPMSDVDILVPPEQRSRAEAALAAAGWRLHSSSAFEDTYLAWGDGAIGRTDGESADHNGRIEMHPGWGEFLHGYVACGASVEREWSREVVAAHVIGHLGSTVVRAEVRAVNVVDVFFLHQHGVSWDGVAQVLHDIDPRLSAPGVWFAHAVFPDAVPRELAQAELRRLPRPRVFDGVQPETLLRDPTQRTTVRWRHAFASSTGEQVAVLRQVVGSVTARLRR